MVPGVPCVDRGNWGRERDIAHSCHDVCFKKKVLASIAPYTFISHTKMSIFFRIESVLELYSLKTFKASQVSSCS